MKNPLRQVNAKCDWKQMKQLPQMKTENEDIEKHIRGNTNVSYVLFVLWEHNERKGKLDERETERKRAKY